MKKMLLPVAVLAIAATSCDTSTKDSYSTVSFYEYSLITDKSNTSEPAQVSATVYDVKLNWTQNTAEVSTTDLTISNQKRSFETQPMELKMGYLMQEGSTNYIDYGSFSSLTGTGTGANVSNLSAGFGYLSYIYSGVYVPGFDTATASNTRMRLLMGYDLNDQYHVQTFWPECFYGGTTNVITDGTSYGTPMTMYRIQMNFEKNTAKCVIYNPVFSEDNTNMPKAIVLEDIPVLFSHTDFYLQADAPKTQVLNAKGTLVSVEEYKAEKSVDLTATNFSLYPTSTDLTRASISCSFGKSLVNFSGSSTVQISSAQ